MTNMADEVYGPNRSQLKPLKTSEKREIYSLLDEAQERLSNEEYSLADQLIRSAMRLVRE